MNYIKLFDILRAYCWVFIILFTTHQLPAQTSSQEQMENLSFMIGEWVGISRAYDHDSITKQVPAFEKISYKLDKSLITINLQSETLQLHTVIYYDDQNKKFYYNPYYKNGTAKYEAVYKDGKFIVMPNDKKRFVFQLTPEGDFQEYGERFENGKWIKYFEDNFKKMQ